MIETGPGWKLRCGDCLDPETGLTSLDAVDHVITDPPYETEAHTKQRRVKRAGGVAVVESLGFDQITEPQRSSLGAILSRLTARWALVFCQVEASQAWALSLDPLRYTRTMVWIKPDGQPQLTGDRPGMGYESIVVAHNGTGSRWNAGGRVGVYICNKNAGKLEGRSVHPTQKPLPLIEDLIRDFTDPTELICDPFAGSGTTGVAAIRLGRRFIGWEKDPEFFAVAVKRLRATREQMELFPQSKPKHKQGALF
jgi:site-specific DNA-methyltransferase (adenine-specific)